MLREDLIQAFYEQYDRGGERNDSEIRTFYAPASLNIVGEHTNYNGGHVLSCATDFGLRAAFRLRGDRHVKIIGQHDSGRPIRDVDLEDPEDHLEEHDWACYVISSVRAFEECGYEIPGFECFFSLDVDHMNRIFFASACYALMCFSLREMLGFQYLRGLDLVELAQKAEDINEGVACGVLNAFSSLMGKKGYASLLDAKGYRYEYIPIDLSGAKFVIANSKVAMKRQNEILKNRRQQCAKALRKLQTVKNITTLCDLMWDTFESCKDVIMNEEVIHRARHPIYENGRTIRAANALRVGKIRKVGMMMYESHCSLRDEFGISCEELDFLVDHSMELPQVIGSRIYGPGLGGCMVSLVVESGIERYMEELSKIYKAEYGVDLDYCVAETDDVARELF